MTPAFQLFENICDELAFGDAVLPDDEFLSPELIEELQNEFGEFDPTLAVPKALKALDEHFKERGSILPFEVELSTRSYTAIDQEYIDFILNCIAIRGSREDSRDFETTVTRRLALRGLGTFHRVGWPRNEGDREKFNKYLHPIGFEDVAYGQEKDGGLDIIWLPPFGAVPHRPIFTFQCKNGSYDLFAALLSNGTTGMSLNCHRALDTNCHTICVVFNDYIVSTELSPKKYQFVPLGLSDLAQLVDPHVTVTIL